MVVNGFKRKNVPPDYLKALKRSKKSKKVTQPTVPKPGDLDWSYVYSNQQLKEIIKLLTSPIFVSLNTYDMLLTQQD